MVQALLTEPILEGLGFVVSANSSIMDEGALVKKSFISLRANSFQLDFTRLIWVFDAIYGWSCLKIL